ncbi:hypothetical protein BCR43DRAFT_494454 [Syncephalastrum racemosum]|uniref:Secreted protein n=1 Tax=Syncephalastrum racemosum TaxID=13706 RepID=A0A1X2H808_SYNRA|nr:hypothetical protein BCR43DRAFT_494454 [Syncephalastrum racemosum]
MRDITLLLILLLEPKQNLSSYASEASACHELGKTSKLFLNDNRIMEIMISAHRLHSCKSVFDVVGCNFSNMALTISFGLRSE